MAVEVKVNQIDDLYLYEILRNPVLMAEFINNFDLTELDAPIELTTYQKEFALDFSNYETLCCARAVGKCVEANSKILNTTTGEYRTVEEWYKLGEEFKVPSIKFETLEQTPNIGRIAYNGVKDCYRITTVGGYQTIVTEEHPLLTSRGFVKAKDIIQGDFIALATNQPYFGSAELPNAVVKIIAHFIAEGTKGDGSITTTELDVIDDVYEYASSINHSVRVNDITFYVTTSSSKNEYKSLLKELGILNCYSYEKFIPQTIFTLTKEKLSLFLACLFGDDGSIERSGKISYCSSSERLIKDLQHLLTRYGIRTSLVVKKNNCKGAFELSIQREKDLQIFAKEIGFRVSRKQEILEALLETQSVVNDTYDLIPIQDFRKYKVSTKATATRGTSVRPLEYIPSRIKAKRILNRDEELKRYEKVDWAKVKSIEFLPEQETYAIEVDNNHTHAIDNIWSHNTYMLSNLIIWLLVFQVYPNDYICYFVPGKAQLDPVWTNLVRLFRANGFLQQFLSPNSGVNSSEFKITLLNQSTLLCRIAGQSGTGANVIGLHTPYVIVDEAGYFPWNVFMELQPIVNTFTPGYKLFTSGVPNGMREKNVLYHCDQENSNYSKHRVSAFQNPRFSEKDRQLAIEQYGGEDSDDYTHYVLGKHGKPVFALFDRTAFAFNDDNVYKMNMTGQHLGDNLMAYVTKIDALPPLPNKDDKAIMCIDLGYTEPSAIIIMYQDRIGSLRFHARIQLDKVSYPIQERIIDILDSKFNPAIIGIDRGSGGQGISVVQHMLEDTEYIHKDYKNRLVPVDFSTSIVVGINADGTELKSKTKPFATSILQEYCNNHKIVFSHKDLEMVAELERMTYTRNPGGEIVYRTLTQKGGKRGEDHFTSSLLCGVMGYYIKHDFMAYKPERKSLAKPKWG